KVRAVDHGDGRIADARDQQLAPEPPQCFPESRVVPDCPREYRPGRQNAGHLQSGAPTAVPLQSPGAFCRYRLNPPASTSGRLERCDKSQAVKVLLLVQRMKSTPWVADPWYLLLAIELSRIKCPARAPAPRHESGCGHSTC